MAKIDASENGPYIVTNLNKLTHSNNEPLETKEVMALCRCGASKTKPFCDGAHAINGFSSKKEREETYPEEEFVGKDITIVDNVGICAHAGECVKGAPDTFFTHEDNKRVSHPDNDGKEKIINTIKKCPSGSLAYKVDGKLEDQYFSEEEIVITKYGPLHVRGSVEFDNSELVSKEHYTLCRCGASKNKPFCDGMHAKTGFKG